VTQIHHKHCGATLIIFILLTVMGSTAVQTEHIYCISIATTITQCDTMSWHIYIAYLVLIFTICDIL